MAAGGMVAQGITIKFSANTSGLTDGAKQAQGVISNFASVGATALLAVGTAAVAGGLAAAKMAGDFQAGMTTLVTGAGESQRNIQMVSQGILDLATKTGTSTKQLTDGMYMIESAGYHGAAGLKVLEAAAEGAKVGNADLGTVSDAVTTVMKDFASQNITAAQATNDLIATVANGKTTMQALASSLSQVMPTASAAGVSLTDTSAAMATMTGEGVTAANAATYLRQTIMSIENPSKKAADTMASLGLKSSDVAEEMKKSLPGALEMITDAAAKKFPVGSAAYVAALAAMVGGTKSMQGILDLAGENLATFKSNVLSISEAVKNGGSAIAGWGNVQQNFNQKMDQAKETLEVLGIQIGSKLLPKIADLVAQVMPAVTAFANWISTSGALDAAFGLLGAAITGTITVASSIVTYFQQNRAALIALQAVAIPVAGVIGGALVFAMTAYAISAWSAAAATIAATWPFLLIGAAIAAVIAVVIILYQRFEPFRAAMNAIGQVFIQIWNILVSSFMPAWQQLIAAFQQAAPAFTIVGQILVGVFLVALGIIIAAIVALAEGIAAAVGGIVQVFTGLVQILSGIFNVIGGIFIFLMDLITGRFSNLAGDLRTIGSGIVQIFTGMWNVIAGVFNAAAGVVGGIVLGFIHALIAYFQNLASVVVGHSIIPDMVNSIISWLMQLPGRAGAAISAMASTVLGQLSGLASSAAAAGANIVQGIANGIMAGIGAVGSAISSVTAYIADHLPHSPAKIGPLRNLAYQGSQIPEQINQGMISNMSKVQSGMKSLFSGSVPSSTFSSSPSVIVHVAASSPAPIYLDGHELTNRLGPHIANMIRMKGDVRAR